MDSGCTPRSWDPWLELFREAGYDPIAPGWPNESATVREAREHPEAVAEPEHRRRRRALRRDHRTLPAPPVILGHSFGGLFTEKLLGQGIGAAGVAIDPAQIKGVLPLPLAAAAVRRCRRWVTRRTCTSRSR